MSNKEARVYRDAGFPVLVKDLSLVDGKTRKLVPIVTIGIAHLFLTNSEVQDVLAGGKVVDHFRYQSSTILLKEVLKNGKVIGYSTSNYKEKTNFEVAYIRKKINCVFIPFGSGNHQVMIPAHAIVNNWRGLIEHEGTISHFEIF
jgi:hypothetical protein